MKPTKITILGEKLNIAFSLAVEIAYEEIAGKSFNVESITNMKDTLALYMAAITVNNPDTNITVERLMKEASGADIVKLQKAVIETMTDWMKMPTVIESAKTKTDEKPKK